MADAYALGRGEGWVGEFGPKFIVKALERETTNGFAFVDFTTVPGEEPGDHTHPTEDEVFYVVDGSVRFRCGDQTLDVETGGFVFLPCGVKHGYTLIGDGEARLIVVTAPPRETSDGWDGFIGGSQQPGARLTRDAG